MIFTDIFHLEWEQLCGLRLSDYLHMPGSNQSNCYFFQDLSPNSCYLNYVLIYLDVMLSHKDTCDVIDHQKMMMISLVGLEIKVVEDSIITFYCQSVWTYIRSCPQCNKKILIGTYQLFLSLTPYLPPGPPQYWAPPAPPAPQDGPTWGVELTVETG